ncbi:hypothetical protein HDU98_011615 [Podochytrium sp. JEL0797]|nr:hypothetical protein HDU98_011615 [Podochytrium sp. JEL0797]
MHTDIAILFITRTLRLFAYGLIGVILVLYMKLLGLHPEAIGSFLTVTLMGDALVSLLVTGHADSFGRKKMLLIGSLLMTLTGLAFAAFPEYEFFTGDDDPAEGLWSWKAWVYFISLVILGTIGVISPSGNEVGPFIALEQSILSKFISFEHRATWFSWYGLIGSFATASGSLFAGVVISHLTESDMYSAYYSVSMLQDSPTSVHVPRSMMGIARNETEPHGDLIPKLEAYRIIVALYGMLGVVLALFFFKLSPEAESAQVIASRAAASLDEEASPLLGPAAQVGSPVDVEPRSSLPAPPARSWLPGLNLSPDTRVIVAKMSFLLTLDSFATSVMTGSMLAYWFSEKYGVDEAYLGEVMFISNILAGLSSLMAGWVSSRIGLVNTMVYTHLPASCMLLLVPFMPNLYWSTAILFIRASISQMDVGPRQAYIASIVHSSERTAVMGMINTWRSLGAAFGPLLTGYLAENGWFDWAFVWSGGLMILYNVLLWWSFGGARGVAAIRRNS